MKKLIRRLFKWAMHDDGSEPVMQPDRLNPSYDFGRTNKSMQFTVIKAENGTVLQTYSYNIEGASFWVVPAGSSIGNMVDTVLVADKLK